MCRTAGVSCRPSAEQDHAQALENREVGPISRLGFGLRVPPCAPIREIGAYARRVEEAGFDTVWIPDSQFLWRDVWTAAALVAERTERIGIGIAITTFETRHVAVTANTIASIDELSGGRLRVAFGTGDSSVKTLGLTPTRHARMREQFGVLRKLLSGGEVAFEGEDERYGGRPMRMRTAQGRAPVPIYMAASGPKALELAGELADGVIVAAGVAPPLVAHALDCVQAGAERAGRRLEDLDLVLAAHTLVAADEQTAVRLVKPLCLTMAQLGAKEALRAVGIELEVPAVVEGIYPDVTHAESWEHAVRASERYIDDESARRYAEGFTLAGTVEQIVERIARAAAAHPAIKAIYAIDTATYELPDAQLDAFATTVIPQFAGDAVAAAGVE